MTNLTIENIVAHAKIADSIDITKLAGNDFDFKYNPNEFSGLTLKLDNPKTAVLILPNGKAICTGARNLEDAEASIKIVTNKIKRAGIKVKIKPKVETTNITVSLDLKKELHLASISKGLMLENVNYEPEEFPGLIYKMDDLGAILLLFGSGKIVCTGASTMEDASKAIELMKEKLSSLGAL
jgi:transcription initiation factor TFIID TATA-box-binding protein